MPTVSSRLPTAPSLLDKQAALERTRLPVGNAAALERLVVFLPPIR